MFNHFKNSLKTFNCIRCFVANNQNSVRNIGNYLFLLNHSHSVRLLSIIHNRSILTVDYPSQIKIYRNKHKGKKKAYNRTYDDSSDEEDEDEVELEEDQNLGKGSQIKTHYVKSLRLDTILKVGLGIARRRVEEVFYENRIRVNGKILKKKSIKVSEGDEIDLIKEKQDHDLEMLNVSRIQILKIVFEQDEERILVQMLKSKNLRTGNYPDEHMWTEPTKEK